MGMSRRQITVVYDEDESYSVKIYIQSHYEKSFQFFWHTSDSFLNKNQNI